IFPEPAIGDHVFTRGHFDDESGSGWGRLHSFSPNRDGGGMNIQVVIRSWDPVEQKFVEVVYQADEFGGDPIVVYEGASANQEIPNESTTQGLTLSVVESRGQSMSERRDVLSSNRFLTDESAEELALRWFELREKLSRWGTATVDGLPDLVPYKAVTLEGNLAVMDKGLWMPLHLTHTFNASGWLVQMRCIRVVTEPVASSA
ncbi:hypothetical protein LCGC14_3048200, partial [marine sediment metagenome]